MCQTCSGQGTIELFGNIENCPECNVDFTSWSKDTAKKLKWENKTGKSWGSKGKR